MGFRNLIENEDPVSRAIIEIMLVVVVAEGNLQDDEVDNFFLTVAQHPKLRGLRQRTVIQIANRAIQVFAKQTIEERIQSIANLLPSETDRLDALGTVMSMAMSDGDVEPEEAELLMKIQYGFGLSNEQVDALINQYR